MEQRLSVLNGKLAPASVDQIGAFVVSLQDQFGLPEMDADALRRRQEGYLIALDGVPAFALDEAYRMILQRRVPEFDPRYMPKGPELRELLDRISRPARYHAVRLRHLLDAKVERPVQRATAEAVAALVQGIAAKMPPSTNRKPKNPANVNHADKPSIKVAQNG